MKKNREIHSSDFPTGDFKIDIIDEPLVDLSVFLRGNVKFKPVYYLNNIEGSIDKIYARKTVAILLQKILDTLEDEMGLLIFDAYRPIQVQESLYKTYFNKLKVTHPEYNENQLADLTKNFVSIPSYDINNPSVHNTGGAIDLTLIDKNGNQLDMGTDFDDFTEVAHTSYFEDKNEEIRNNRRILFNTMIDHGFTNLPTEWWHYDYGTKFWSIITKQPMKYTGISLKED